MKAFQSVRSQRAVSPSRVGVLCSETGAGCCSALNETMKGCSVMRSRITSALVALMAVLALGAVAASGASAHEYFIEGKSMKELGLKEETFSPSKATLMTISGPGYEMYCKAAVSGVIKAGGTGTTKFTLSECEVVGLGDCSLEPSIVFKANSSLVELGEPGQLQNEFSIPESEAVAVHFLGEHCSETTWSLWGYLLGNVSEVESSTLKLAFRPFEYSEVRFGGNPAGVKFGLSMQLSGANAGKKWSAKK